jgi:hypothetical protein
MTILKTLSTPARLAALLLLLAALTGCLDPDDGDKDPGPGEDTTVYALARIQTTFVEGVGDTQVTAFTYDAQGRKVRERFSFITLEWDSLGRYVRWTQHDARDTVEIATWLTADSSIRGSAHSTLQTRERWFGLRPNCRCADSMYRYSFNGALNHVRRYTYDAHGNLTLVTRDYANPARRDTAQRYENFYLAHVQSGPLHGRLASRISYDAELEDTTRQFFEYEPLDSLLEAR